MDSQQEIIDSYDLESYLGVISRRISLRGEMLRGISQLWVEYDSIEGAEIASQLGVELGHIGRQLKLFKNQLCQKCATTEVAEFVSFGSVLERCDGRQE